jgi:hypothetical protein
VTSESSGLLHVGFYNYIHNPDACFDYFHSFCLADQKTRDENNNASLSNNARQPKTFFCLADQSVGMPETKVLADSLTVDGIDSRCNKSPCGGTLQLLEFIQLAG